MDLQPPPKSPSYDGLPDVVTTIRPSRKGNEQIRPKIGARPVRDERDCRLVVVRFLSVPDTRGP